MSKKPKENNSLLERIEVLEGSIKKYTLIGILSGVILGGGGVFGTVQWVYTAPLDKKIKSYESAMSSLKGAIVASNDAGTVEEVAVLRKELIALDRNYREALGLITKCMEVLSTRGLDREWLGKAKQRLQVLSYQRWPISEKPNS
jgi:hypothetical protein